MSFETTTKQRSGVRAADGSSLHDRDVVEWAFWLKVCKCVCVNLQLLDTLVASSLVR